VQGDAGRPVNKVVDPKRIMGKMDGRGGGDKKVAVFNSKL
jgi:hypothetical protein